MNAIDDPNVTLFTVMKNEGPFILEWIAHHQAIGIRNFIVLTNDCDDGTDLILDRLMQLGHVRHSPNPTGLGENMIKGARHHHIVGFAYGKLFPEWQNADYVYLSDVDEFLNIHVGEGHIRDLIAASDHADVISINERLFGTGLIEEYREGLITEQFLYCSSARPGRWRARRGLKSLSKVHPNIDIRNHRPLVDPELAPDLNWRDGANEPFPKEIWNTHEKGTDCRGKYQLATVHHYPLRSMETFLCKTARGDAVAQYDDRLDIVYFRRRNRVDDYNTSLAERAARTQAIVDDMLQDERLAELHYGAVRHHRNRINQLKAMPDFSELLGQLRNTREKSIEIIDRTKKPDYTPT